MCWSMFRLCMSKSLCNLFIIYSLFRGLGFIHMFALQWLCEQPFKGKEIKLNVSLLVAYSEIFWNRPYHLTQSFSWRIHWLYNLMKVDSSLNNAVICLSLYPYGWTDGEQTYGSAEQIELELLYCELHFYSYLGLKKKTKMVKFTDLCHHFFNAIQCSIFCVDSCVISTSTLESNNFFRYE